MGKGKKSAWGSPAGNEYRLRRRFQAGWAVRGGLLFLISFFNRFRDNFEVENVLWQKL